MAGSARKFSDGALRLTGVTDHTDPSAPAAISSATAVTGRLYDGVRRSRIAADLAATGTDLVVDDPSHFAAGDAVQIRLADTTTLHDTTVSSVDAATRTIVLADAIPGGGTAPAGGWIQKPIGSSFDMNSTYGTPAASDHTWGYIGFYDDDIDLFDVEYVRAEVDFNGGAGKRLFKALTVPVLVED